LICVFYSLGSIGVVPHCHWWAGSWNSYLWWVWFSLGDFPVCIALLIF